VNAFILQTTSICWRSVTGKSLGIAITLGNSKSFKHFYHTLVYSICLLTMSKRIVHSKKCWYILGQIWTNPNVGLKMQFKNVTRRLGLSIKFG